MLIVSAALAAATLAPATAPPSDSEAETVEAVVLDAFIAELETERPTGGLIPQPSTQTYLAPVCVFWVTATDDPDFAIWWCYATLGDADDVVWDVAASIVTYDGTTGEATVRETSVYDEGQILSD